VSELEAALYVLREHLRSMNETERVVEFDRIVEGGAYGVGASGVVVTPC
jgi:hypothetical protein